MNAAALRRNLEHLRNSGHATDEAIAEIQRAINDYETGLGATAKATAGATSAAAGESAAQDGQRGAVAVADDTDALHHVRNAPYLSPAAQAVLRMIDTSIEGTSISNTPDGSTDRSAQTAAATRAGSANLATLTSGIEANPNKQPEVHGGTSDLFFSLAMPVNDSGLSPALTQQFDLGKHEAAEAKEFREFEANRFKRRYKLLETVGQGAFGQVYRARDHYLHRDVALKRLNVRNFNDRHKNAVYLYRYSLVLEARIGAQLVHPNLVPIHDFGVDDEGDPYVVMRFLQGGRTLRDILRERERGKLEITRDELLRVLLRAIDGLAYAHERGVVNRDVKPENIYVADHGDVTVLDWGVARLMDETSVDLAAMSAAVKDEVAAAVLDNPEDALARSLLGGNVGTVPYMSPEQVESRLHDIDRRTDVWAVGVILYEILTGQWPFEGDAALQVQMRIRSGHYSSAKTRVDDLHNGKMREGKRVPWLPDRVPSALDTIVRKALAHKQEDRYPTLCAMAYDIQSFLNDRPLEDASPVEVIQKWAKRNRRLVTAIGATSLMFLVVLAIGLFAYVTAVTTERDKAQFASEEARVARNQAEAARDDAEFAREDALAQERKAKQRLAQGLLANGDALGLQERWTEAREAYDEALALLTELGEEPFPASVGQWDTDRNAPWPVFTLSDFDGEIASTTFSADGQRAIVADTSGTLSEWDLTTGMRMRTIARQDARLQILQIELAPAGDLLVVANGDGAVRAYEMVTGDLRWERPLGSDPVTNVAVAPDSSFVLAATAGQMIARVDGVTGTVRATLDAEGDIRDVKISPTGDVAAAAVFVQGVLLLDVSTRLGGVDQSTLEVIYQWEFERPDTLAFSPHGPRLAAVGSWTIAVYDLDNRDADPLTQRSRRDVLTGVTFTPCDNLIVFNLNSFDVWLLDQDRILWSITVQRHIPRTLRFSPDGTMALLGLQDGKVGYWNIYIPGASRVLLGHRADLRAAAFTHDNRIVFSGDLWGEVWAWDVATAQPVGLYTFDRPVMDIAVTRDNRTLVVGLSDDQIINPGMGRVVAVDLATREYTVLWDNPDHCVARGALSGDGQYALVTIEETLVEGEPPMFTAAMLEVATGEVEVRFEGLTAKPLTAAYSPDDQRVAIAGHDGSMHIFDRYSGELQAIAARSRSLGPTYQITFSPDSKFVLCGNSDFTVYAIDAATGKTARVMHGHTGPVVSITMISGMPMSVGFDNRALLWNLETGELIHTFATPHAAFLGAIPSDDSRYGVMGGTSGALELWDTEYCKSQQRLMDGMLAAQKRLAVDPNDGDAYLAIAHWLEFKNACGLALRSFERAEQLGAERTTDLALARCFWTVGEYDRARELFENARAAGKAPDWYIDYLVGALPND